MTNKGKKNAKHKLQNASSSPRGKEGASAKKRKLSTDYVSGDEVDDKTKWNLDEKLNETRYNASFVRFLDAKDFNLKYFQENGFKTPLVFTDKSGLGLRVPSENFKVSDVKACVGSKRIVDVVDVNTQKGLTMSMKDWCQYYESGERDRLLNVISLEFSHTKLENYVDAPTVVKQVDWIDNVWPQSLVAAHTESTNLMDKMKYPKVQKYVLMSVAGCYTDFHIDMGGTSVWYHILKGSKIFWLMPPTEKNLKIYEKWTLSGEQSNVFLPDLVEECQRIELQKGWTFMLPSGWIHGVYTKNDSLVFGGNFLHSFNIPMQLKVYQIEQKTKVPLKHRYPFFLEMLWFAIERYNHCLTGVTHLKEMDADGNEVPGSSQTARQTFDPAININHLTKYEYDGIKAVHTFMKSLAANKRQVPKEIVEPEKLLDSVEKFLKEETESESKASITGTPLTNVPKPDKKYMKKAKGPGKKAAKGGPVTDVQPAVQVKVHQGPGGGKTGRKHNMRDIPRTKGSIKKRLRPQTIPRSAVERRRRVRCHKCEPCTRDDCGECKYCKDMKKFGGTGVSKQCCLSKQCLAPLLPTTSVCMYCGDRIDRKNADESSMMYECEICFEIYHIECFKKQYKSLKHIEPIVNEDLTNCWTCSNCIYKGFHSKLKEEREREKEGKDDTEENSLSLDSLSNNDKKFILEQFCENYQNEDGTCAIGDDEDDDENEDENDDEDDDEDDDDGESDSGGDDKTKSDNDKSVNNNNNDTTANESDQKIKIEFHDSMEDASVNEEKQQISSDNTNTNNNSSSDLNTNTNTTSTMDNGNNNNNNLVSYNDDDDNKDNLFIDSINNNNDEPTTITQILSVL